MGHVLALKSALPLSGWHTVRCSGSIPLWQEWFASSHEGPQKIAVPSLMCWPAKASLIQDNRRETLQLNKVKLKNEFSKIWILPRYCMSNLQFVIICRVTILIYKGWTMKLKHWPKKCWKFHGYIRICAAWPGNSTAAQKIWQSTQHNGRMSEFKWRQIVDEHLAGSSVTRVGCKPRSWV